MGVPEPDHLETRGSRRALGAEKVLGRQMKAVDRSAVHIAPRRVVDHLGAIGLAAPDQNTTAFPRRRALRRGDNLFGDPRRKRQPRGIVGSGSRQRP